MNMMIFFIYKMNLTDSIHLFNIYRYRNNIVSVNSLFCSESLTTLIIIMKKRHFIHLQFKLNITQERIQY